MRAKAIGAGYRSDRNWARFSEAFLKYRRTQNVAIEAMAQKTPISRCALPCFEADPIFCHRSLLAAASARQRDTPLCHI
jgi:hypothetical protein